MEVKTYQIRAYAKLTKAIYQQSKVYNWQTSKHITGNPTKKLILIINAEETKSITQYKMPIVIKIDCKSITKQSVLIQSVGFAKTKIIIAIKIKTGNLEKRKRIIKK